MKKRIMVLFTVVLFSLSIGMAFSVAADKKSSGKKLKGPSSSGYVPGGHGAMEEEDDDPFGTTDENLNKDDVKPQYLDKEMILNTMKRKFPQIKSCYEKVLKMNKKIKGVVVVEFKIQVDGSTSDIKVLKKKSTLKNKMVLNCVKNRIATIKFPKRRKGEPQTVRFPFKFVPKTTE